MSTKMSTKIFLSYTHQDSRWASEFAEALKGHGLTPWLADWEIAPGDRVAEAIERGLSSSDVVVIIFGGDRQSPNLFFELGAAVGMNKRVIPVISRNVDVASLPIPLRQIQYLIQQSPEQTADAVARAVA